MVVKDQHLHFDQELRARRLFHLIQQAFTGYPKIEHMIRNQIMARGAADANGYMNFSG